MPIDQWHFGSLRSNGPVTLAELRALVVGGYVRGDTLVWHPGMPHWREARTVTELDTVFGVAPATVAGPSPVYPRAGDVTPPLVIDYRSPESTEWQGEQPPVPLAPPGVEALWATAGWTRLLAAFSLLLGLGYMVLGFYFAFEEYSPFALWFRLVVGVVHLVMGGVSVWAARVLDAAGAKAVFLARTRRAEDLDAMLQANHRAWRFLGVMTLVWVALIVAGIAVSVLARLL